MEKHKLEQGALGFMFAAIVANPSTSPAECARKAIACARALDEELQQQPEFQEKEIESRYCNCETPESNGHTKNFCCKCNKYLKVID